jgi:hypothetical protein
MSSTRNRLTDGAGRVSVLVVLAAAAVIAMLFLGGLLLADTTLGSRLDLPLIHPRASDEGGDDEPDENEVSDSGRGSGEREPAEREPAEGESDGREP